MQRKDQEGCFLDKSLILTGDCMTPPTERVLAEKAWESVHEEETTETVEVSRVKSGESVNRIIINRPFMFSFPVLFQVI